MARRKGLRGRNEFLDQDTSTAGSRLPAARRYLTTGSGDRLDLRERSRARTAWDGYNKPGMCYA